MTWRTGESTGRGSCNTNCLVQCKWSSFENTAGLAKHLARALKKEAFQAALQVSNGKNGWTRTSNKQSRIVQQMPLAEIDGSLLALWLQMSLKTAGYRSLAKYRIES